MEGSVDKNQSYFFLFDKEKYTMDQVRAFTLEECYQHCINDEEEGYDSRSAEYNYNLYIETEADDYEPWLGYGVFLHTRLALGEEYVCYEMMDEEDWDLHFEPEEYEVVLNDGRRCFIHNEPYSLEWGGIEFEDETKIDFEDIPTELLDELVEKTPLVRKVTLQQFEDDWYQQKAGYVAIRKCQ